MSSQIDSAWPAVHSMSIFTLCPQSSGHYERGPDSADCNCETAIRLPIFTFCENSDSLEDNFEKVGKLVYFESEGKKEGDHADCESCAFRSHCLAFNVGTEGDSVVSFIFRVSFEGKVEEHEMNTAVKCFGAAISRVTWKDKQVFPTWSWCKGISLPDDFVGLIEERDKTKIQEWMSAVSQTILMPFRGERSSQQESKPSFSFGLKCFILEGAAIRD